MKTILKLYFSVFDVITKQIVLFRFKNSVIVMDQTSVE